ncbi:MAG: RHS repeat-associated core domain-containing protein, partial [Acidimicrobiales bacterium]
ASMIVAGNGKIALDKGATGPGASGITIFADPASSGSIQVTGGGSLATTGSIDAPSMGVSVTGNASLRLNNAALVAAEVESTGTGAINASGSFSLAPTIIDTFSHGLLSGYQSSDGTDATFAYDGTGLRAGVVVNGVSQPFSWGIATGVPQLLSDTANYYVYGPSGTPIEQVSQATGKATYLYADELGTVTMECDGSGNVIGTQGYNPYGTLASSTGTDPTPFGFAGGYTDPTGLVYLIDRYYDTATGQFMSADPLVAETGQPYAYVGGDPVNGRDPSGACSDPRHPLLFEAGFCANDMNLWDNQCIVDKCIDYCPGQMGPATNPNGEIDCVAWHDPLSDSFWFQPSYYGDVAPCVTASGQYNVDANLSCIVSAAIANRDSAYEYLQPNANTLGEPVPSAPDVPEAPQLCLGGCSTSGGPGFVTMAKCSAQFILAAAGALAFLSEGAAPATRAATVVGAGTLGCAGPPLAP